MTSWSVAGCPLYLYRKTDGWSPNPEIAGLVEMQWHTCLPSWASRCLRAKAPQPEFDQAYQFTVKGLG